MFTNGKVRYANVACAMHLRFKKNAATLLANEKKRHTNLSAPKTQNNDNYNVISNYIYHDLFA